jgi:hypothetical protein
MSPQEKQALLQFMGVTYGQAIKTDRDIVAHSGNLRPVSDQLKQQFEQVMATPTQAPAPSAPPQWVPVEVVPQQQDIPIPPEVVPNYKYSLEEVVSTSTETPFKPVVSTITGDDIIKVLTNIQVALENIATILDKQPPSNVKTAKSKAKEQG